jgi:hypothetical protein
MKVSASALAVQRERADAIAPEPGMLVRALRQIGYTLEQALSDLVDNAISADARNILIRFIVDDENVRGLVIADDGSGMSEAWLTEAMKFGSETDVTRRTLGKYGLGMKLASLSHAESVTVVTRQRGIASARRWTLEGIRSNWACDVIPASDAGRLLDAPWGHLDLSRHGTLVIWDRVDRLPTGNRGLRETLRQIQRRLQTHLGLTFHRFLTGTQDLARVRIAMDLQYEGEFQRSHSIEIAALDPFGYPASGHSSWPQTFPVTLGGDRRFNLFACIWPANSECEEYRLGNRAAARQGFYFYRNDRLIQAGGWNGLVQSDTEPHSSLARVGIDLPPELDGDFALNVQKSAVIVPPTFLPAVTEARSRDGMTFEDYRRAAQAVYRGQDARATREQPLMPGHGLPAQLRMLAIRMLGGMRGGREVEFRWAELDDGHRVFQLDRDGHRILLNRQLRDDPDMGSRGGVMEGPLLKMCLFLLLQEDLDRDRLSESRRRRLEAIDALLGEALALERR